MNSHEKVINSDILNIVAAMSTESAFALNLMNTKNRFSFVDLARRASCDLNSEIVGQFIIGSFSETIESFRSKTRTTLNNAY